MLFDGFLFNDPSLIRHSDLGLVSVMLFAIITNLARLAIEQVGTFEASLWWFGMLSNTLSFSFLLVFFSVPLLNVFFGRFNKQDLLASLRLTIPWHFFTFIIAGVFNLFFHYGVLHWRFVFHPEFLPTYLLMPMGSIVGFAFILYTGTRAYKALFGGSTLRTFVTLFAAFALTFGYTYIVGIAAAWGPDWQLYYPENYPGHTADRPRYQFYSLTFLLPNLIFLPVLARKLELRGLDRRAMVVLYLVMIAVALMLLNNTLALVPGLVF